MTQAAQKAISGIEQMLAFWNAGQNIWYGLSLGSVLLLAAIGLAITFGVMGVINMAHGEMVMLGAYTTFVVQETIRNSAPQLFDYSLAIAIPLAFLVSGAAGFVIERAIIRWLYGRPLETLLATWGLSLILQQAVRTIFGANNRQVGNPSWMSGAFDLGHLTITYNRMWIVVFALLVFVVLNIILKATPFGLQMRAVTQNRRMAASMGIRTPWIDALHLRARLGHRRHGGRGALADRQRLAQSRPGLHHRQLHGGGVRRRRQSLGNARRRLHARRRQQVPRALFGRRAGQDPGAGLHHPVHPEAPARPVRAAGPGGGILMSRMVLRALDRNAVAVIVLVLVVAAIVPVLHLAVPRTSPFHVPTYLVALFGKYLCYALLAVALNLVWGYCGILSLGHGAFFALGGYAMGMYLMRQIGTRGVYANPILPDFMVFLNWKELPWFWYGFDSFIYAAIMVRAGAGPARLRLRLVRLPQPRHRRLSLHHHAGAHLCAAARLLPQRHGLRRQ